MTAEVLDGFPQLITTALGLLAALVSNTAIQQLFDETFGKAAGELDAKFSYAVLLTLIFITVAVSRAAERAKEAEERRGGLFGRSKGRG